MNRIPEPWNVYIDHLKKKFVEECLELGANEGKQAVVDGARDIARKKVEELRKFVMDSESASHRQRVLAMCAFEAVLKGALRTLEIRAGFLSYLLSMIGGAGFFLTGWWIHGLAKGPLLVLNSTRCVGVFGAIGAAAATGIVFGVLGAAVALGAYSIYRYIVDKHNLNKLTAQITRVFSDDRKFLDDCIPLTSDGKGVDFKKGENNSNGGGNDGNGGGNNGNANNGSNHVSESEFLNNTGIQAGFNLRTFEFYFDLMQKKSEKKRHESNPDQPPPYPDDKDAPLLQGCRSAIGA